MMGRLRAALFVALIGVVPAACGIQVTDLPLPGTRVSGDSYSLKLEFANVLNLPARSKVLLNGTKVGVLREVALGGTAATPAAIATVDLQDDAEIPRGTRAALQQSTLLGDIYISLIPPAQAGGAMMRDGDSIPLAQTTVTPAVEDLLGGIASLANGGTLEKLQKTVNKANEAFPEQIPERDKGIEVTRELVARIAENRGPVTDLLNSLSRIATTVDARGPALSRTLTVGPDRLQGALSAFIGFAQVLTTLGPNVKPIGDLLVLRQEAIFGLVDVVDPLIATAVRLDATAPQDMATLRSIVDDQLVPLLRDPSVNIVDFSSRQGVSLPTTSDGQLTSIAATLRMIGAMR